MWDLFKWKLSAPIIVSSLSRQNISILVPINSESIKTSNRKLLSCSELFLPLLPLSHEYLGRNEMTDCQLMLLAVEAVQQGRDHQRVLNWNPIPVLPLSIYVTVINIANAFPFQFHSIIMPLCSSRSNIPNQKLQNPNCCKIQNFLSFDSTRGKFHT